jgi:hypothetical protein
MQALMSMMDRELEKESRGASEFERVGGGLGERERAGAGAGAGGEEQEEEEEDEDEDEDEDKDEEEGGEVLPPVDIELNLVKNILRSPSIQP